MGCRSKISFLTALVLIASALPTTAQTVPVQAPPQLIGTWKGLATAVSLGANPYRVQDGNAPYFSKDTIEFIFNITEQQDGRFAGTLRAGSGSETLIGSLRPPNFTEGIILDDDGRYTFTMRDAKIIDLCYDHNYPKSKVVACYTLEKQ